MAQMTEVLLPDIGDFKDVEVIEILVRPGDTVAVEDPLITLESDKASMDIPAPSAGTVGEIRVAVGDKINEGDLILLLAAAGEPGGEAPTPVDEAPAAEAAEMVDDAPGVVEPTMPQPDLVVAAGEARDVLLPDIGDFHDVEVIEILVGVGDEVAEEQSLLTLESDKATMEIPAPFAGVVQSIGAAIGDKINKGDLLMTLATAAQGTVAAGDAAPAEDMNQPTGSPAQAAEQIEAERAAGEKEPLRRPVIARPEDAPRGKAHASPGVRRFARELGVDLYHVPGSGPKGRITKEDVQGFVKRALSAGAPAAATPPSGGLALPAMPEIDFSQFGDIEEQPLGRIKKLSGAHLHRAWLNVPHVTQFDEADITELEAFRKSQKDEAARADVKLTFMPFLMKAVCKAMAEYPQFNSSLSADGEKLILKKYMHIGVAVDTPNGLVVPVIRDVDQKGIFDLARDLGTLGDKARAGKLSPTDMQGGSLSISSLGGIGGTQFTPIVNAPEVAILGVSRAAMQPKWDGAAFVPRLVMPFSLSYDHRVIDGAEGVRFTRYLGELLGDIRKLLL
ncbi:MAG: dihydrolipoyllysine-residue acetyltransferase [Gammaproteobacteria bacterium]|nr:dihydrolipoyllysine-residue acetyltransferase [Gammaproteobacteria bacterium]